MMHIDLQVIIKFLNTYEQFIGGGLIFLMLFGYVQVLLNGPIGRLPSQNKKDSKDLLKYL